MTSSSRGGRVRVCARTASVLMLAGAAVLGCGNAESARRQAADAGPAVSAPVSTFEFDAVSSAFVLRRGDSALLEFDADGFQLGRVDAASDAANYDPYGFVSGTGAPPAGLAWESPTEIVEVEAARRYRLSYPDDIEIELVVDRGADDRYALELLPRTPVPERVFYRLVTRVDRSEGFYGLGEYFDDVNHRGHVRAMQLELQPQMEGSNNEAHVPVPFVTGTRGWGLFVQSSRPAVFDVATASEDVIEATFGTGLATSEGLRFHLFAAAHPLDVTRHYYEVTGYPRLPAPWALGPWIWRDENVDQAQVESDLRTIRELDLATTGYWIDRPYASAVNTFDFSPAMFTDAPAMIDLMHALGFQTALWHSPYVDESDPLAADLHQLAVTEGYFPSATGLLSLNGWSDPIDLTNPDAYAWWQGNVRRYVEMGVAGFKLDYGEDVVPGLLGQRSVWSFHDGSDERTMHAEYQRLYHRVYAETLPESGGFLLCRGGTWGDQVNVSVIWPGDLDASFARFAEKRDDGEGAYVAVGGLPAAVIAGQTLGPSGFPFFGSDTGGYRHSPPDEETWLRWVEHTALSTVMQIGTSSNSVAWELEENGFTEEGLATYRRYTRLHLRLWPYLWTYAQRLKDDGRPIQRALGLAYPDLGVHPSDTYLLGDSLLVAPVVTRDARERDIVLPPGDWFDWWTGERIAGARTVVRAAPLDTLPLLLAEGGIVPLLRESIDTIAPTTVPEQVDSFATEPGVLHAVIASGPASEFVLFDGTTLTQETHGATVVLRSTPGSEFQSGIIFELVGFDAAPRGVTVDGDAVSLGTGFSFDGASRRVRVDVGAGGHTVEITR